MTETALSNANKHVYRRFIELLNEQNFDALPEVVDVEKYHEICVGFTPGRVNFTDAIASLKKVLIGIPNLSVELEECIAQDTKVYARLQVRGKHSGKLFGIPATGNSYQVQMFDYVQIEDNKIVERIQQSDNLGQMLALFKGSAIKTSVAVGALLTVLTFALIVK